MKKIIAILVVLVLLVFSFWYGGDSPGLQGFDISKQTEIIELEQSEETKEPESEIVEQIPEQEEQSEKLEDIQTLEQSSEQIEQPATQTQEQTELTVVQPTEQQEIIEQSTVQIEEQPTEQEAINPDEAVISDKILTATLTVRCDTILQNIDWLDKAKVDLVPEDGVIYATQTVEFYEGESAFNVLLRQMKANKIHMEYENTPIYNSAYIEGINNIYEFDCGEGSGWMYSINGWFPNYGISRYALKEGDVIEVLYTCNLGLDIGGGLVSQGDE